MDKHNKLLSLALILALLLLAVTGFALVWSITHKTDTQQLINNQIKTEVAKNKPQNGVNGIGVQGDRGLQGYPGVKGDAGAMGSQGISGLQGSTGAQGQQGIQGPAGTQGVTGEKGDQGNPGANGKEVEFRCDPETHNYQWRYVGEEGWTNIQENSNACKSTPL